MRILWAGWGDLGRRATDGLVADGHELIALRRRIDDDPPPPGVTWLEGDLEASDDLPLPSGIDTCVVTFTPRTRDPAGYTAAYEHSTANLYSLLELYINPPNPRPPRVVFASSTAVYGESDGSWVQETTSTSPSRFNGEVMARAERLILDHPHTRGVVARLGGIYGPGRDRLVRTTRAGAPVSDKWTNRIHSDDAAAALAHLATANDKLVPDVVNVVDTTPARKSDVVAHIARLLDIPAPPVDHADPGDPQADRGKRVDGTRLLTTGFRHRHPTHEHGYEALLSTAPQG